MSRPSRGRLLLLLLWHYCFVPIMLVIADMECPWPHAIAQYKNSLILILEIWNILMLFVEQLKQTVSLKNKLKLL